uniref:Ricin B-type lectin domain-containing protein n=1 Tax=Panagrolaimus sp. PS1159 TaxID=55785 RepID=A0AC35FWT7_9BILA
MFLYGKILIILMNRNCIVDAEFNNVDFGINRRTITLLFDFFGALGIKKDVVENTFDDTLARPFDEKDLKLLYGTIENIPDIFKNDISKTEIPQKSKKKKEDYLFHLKFAISTARIYMTYPTNQTQLGTILLNSAAVDLKINLKDVEEPMTLKILASELFIHDETPFYSRFYSERLSLKSSKNDVTKKGGDSDESRKLQIDIIKYRTDDLDLKRKCDMKVNMIVEEECRLYYIHTHRFFCSFMDFWMHFAELQDQVRRTNENIGVPEEQQKMRTLIEIDFLGGASFILPLNQFSDQIILWNTSKISISNRFQLGSQTPELHEQCVENKTDSYNCLLEKMEIKLSEISIHEGYRISVDQEAANETNKVFSRKIGNFQNYYFAVNKNGILTKTCNLVVGLYRNLSGLISHNTPDVIILTKFENIDLIFSTDFYCLLRGFLEKNLGEQLIPVPDTIPLEILQNPDRGYTIETVEKYQTFSFRLTFVNVQFHFVVPQNCRFSQPGKNKKFGRMVLNKARISYDSYVDSLAEFDLICENTELIDTRFEDAKDAENENSFPLILSSKEKIKPNEGNFMKLMSEIHIMMKKDEAPIVTLVLQNSRIIMILDWLNNAKDFFLLNTSFVPPEETSAQKHLYGAPKNGILTRTFSDQRRSTLHTITLKITLRDSDLILVEQTNNPSSLALVCFTTAVLNLSDQFGIIETNFEIQKLNCAWCIMSSEETTRCQITNDFTATILVKKDILPMKEQAQNLIRNGLNETMPLNESSPKQKIIIELGELVSRTSYKDTLVLASVFNGSFERLKHSFENSLIPKINHIPGKPPFNFQKIYFSADNISFWFLDDSQGVALPMLRLTLSSIQVESYFGENLSSTFQANIDYFNQKIYGWEPFIEPWKIKHFNLLWKSDYLHIGLKTFHDSPLDINITQTLIQQVKHFYAKWITHKRNLDRDFRNFCIRSRADHLPYLLKNETGSNLLFTTEVEEILHARSSHRKSNAKWFSVAQNKNCTFEFPVKRLIAKDKANESRQLIVRVDRWDEISAVDVDSVGTYFRLTRSSGSASKRDSVRARVVVEVTMDADGRKVVTIRSALLAINQLLNPIILRFSDSLNRTPAFETHLQSGDKLSIPLKFVNSEMNVRPFLNSSNVNGQTIDWRIAKTPGEIVNKTLKYEVGAKENIYWMCISIKRENFPEYESLSGHTIVFVPPMSVTNLLPVEIEITVESSTKQSYRIGAGNRFQLASVDLNIPLYFTVRTEQFKTKSPVMINRIQFIDRTIQDDKRIAFPMIDGNNRALDMYGSVYISRGGSLQISLWVPYWVVNRSGIPLIIKQEATAADAAGQFEEHEKAKDRNPLMFSFSDQNCPEQCVVRVGKNVENDPEYKPQYCKKFQLSSGAQALKLLLTHEFQATLMYDIGSEVRQCTGKYKNTQIVLFTPRYRLNNQSSTQLFVCHHEDVLRPNHHIPLAAKCNLIWHESFEDKRRLCIRRADVAHWSNPFRIDQIGSFHITMRDRDETPKFVRAEVALKGASFWVEFSDAFYFPAPIKIENQSNVPVLYHQASKDYNRFRTICKANSSVDYFWDDLYGEKLLTLQVYENKSHNYDPSKPIRGPSLIYENYFYIQFTPSFSFSRESKDVETENHDLVMEAKVNGKVVLNKLNLADSSQRQLWKIASDNSLENIGMNHTSKNNEKFVLDVLDTNGNALMLKNRNVNRNPTQKWRFTTEGTLSCGVKDMAVEMVDPNRLILSKQKSENVPKSQQFNMQRQKPGSGKLDVECLHVGPTLMVRISDHADTSLPLMLSFGESLHKKSRSSSPASSVLSQRRSRASMEHSNNYFNVDGEISPINIGISLVNNMAEELIYIRFQGVQMHFCRIDKTYQITGHVNTIQADNQLLTTDRWQVLYCQVNALNGGDIDSPNFESLSNSSPNEFDLPIRPALKFELNCTPMEHYDAFDCFRIKLCDMCILLDETLLWKLVHFMHETGADVISKDSMLQPPNIEPDMNASGSSSSEGIPTRRCYFGTLDLEAGNIALTVTTVAKNGLSKDLQALKRQFNIKLVSFENAIVFLPPFRQFHYFETLKFLVESLSKFYMMELQKQTINIVVTMDAFGNPRGLATDLKESFQGLVFEADITGFVYGLGYGVTNSLSKVASSMSHGVGSLTFDEQHELMRRRMMRIQPQSDNSSAALSHFCNGVKGFGVGVYGGLTAIGGNISKTTKKDGIIAGVTKGFITGALDTVTKPTQGFFDLLEGTASAVKEVVGSHSSKKSRFSDRRVRLPRVCKNLQTLLPVYSTELAEAQQELLRINGYSTNEILLDVEVILQHKNHDFIEQRALICSEQCYCLRQINNTPASVTQRIPYGCFKNIFIDESTDVGKGYTCVAVTYDTVQRSMPSPRIVCGDKNIARRLCEKLLRAKQLYDHSKRTLAVTDEFECDNVHI